MPQSRQHRHLGGIRCADWVLSQHLCQPMCTSTRAETKGTKGTEVTEHVAADPVWRLLEVADSDSLRFDSWRVHDMCDMAFIRYLQAGLTVMLTQKKVPIPTTLCSQVRFGLVEVFLSV